MLTNVIANINETAVLAVMPSPRYAYVKIAKLIVPIPNPISLPGHNIPSKCSTINLVPYMKLYDIGKQNISAIMAGCSLAHFHTNWPLV